MATPTAINNLGQVVGLGGGAGLLTHGLLWDDGVLTDLGDLPGGIDSSFAYDVNDLAQVVGSSAGPFATAFVWKNDVITALPDLPGGESVGEAYGINNLGQVVGFSHADTGGRATLWDNGVVTDLGDIPGGRDFSIARDINNRGQVVGSSITDGNVRRAFLWGNGTLSDLGTLKDGLHSIAVAINDVGLIVGHVSAGDNESHGVIWDKDGQIYDLNALIDPHDPLAGVVTIATAADINALGQIVGNAEMHGQTLGHLLTPIPIPPALSLFLVPVVTLLGRRRRAIC